LSDFSRLEEKLTKLRGRERTPGEPRKLRGSDAAERLAAFVTEIDETILPRRLTLTVDDTPWHFAIANRRLQALLAPAIGDAAALAGKPLPDAEDPSVPALAKILREAFAGSENIRISAVRLTSPFPSDVGVPAPMLARIWNVGSIETAEVPPEERMRTFLSGLGRDALAWLRIDGEEVAEQGGDAERVGRMAEQAAVFLDGYFGKFDSLFPDPAQSCVTVVSPGIGEAPSVLFVEYGEASAFIAAPTASVARLAMAWQRMVTE